MKAYIQKEIEFDAGHRVSTHQGKCRSPHGHRYRVVVGVEGPINEDESSPEFGMVVDFGFLKELLVEYIHDPFDHGFIVWNQDREMMSAFGLWLRTSTPSVRGWKVFPVPAQPTAENLARMFFNLLDSPIHEKGMLLVRVEVWETPTSMAVWSGE